MIEKEWFAICFNILTLKIQNRSPILKNMFNQITILGPGLLGASLAMAAKKNKLCQKVSIWSRSEYSRNKCKPQAWCDQVYDTPIEAIVSSELVILCTPVATIGNLLKEIAPHLHPDALVTDVGSTKAEICKVAESINTDSLNFLGSHPMAGSEKTGLEHARVDLFESSACILTPTESSNPAHLETLKSFWEALKMQVFIQTPETHDTIVAHLSHLPHALAAILSAHLFNHDSDWASMSGAGLKDTTRVAAGSPELWQQILFQNKTSVLDALERFESILQRFKIALSENDTDAVTKILEDGKKFRETLNHD